MTSRCLVNIIDMLSEQVRYDTNYPNKSLRSMLGLTIDKLSELFSYILYRGFAGYVQPLRGCERDYLRRWR